MAQIRDLKEGVAFQRKAGGKIHLLRLGVRQGYFDDFRNMGRTRCGLSLSPAPNYAEILTKDVVVVKDGQAGPQDLCKSCVPYWNLRARIRLTGEKFWDEV